MTFAPNANIPVRKVDHTTTSVSDGGVTIATHAVRTQLAVAAAKWVVLQSTSTNTGRVSVGGSGIATNGSSGVSLAPGESVTIPVDDLSDVWVVTTVDGDKIQYTYGV